MLSLPLGAPLISDVRVSGIRSLVYVVQLSIFGVHCHMQHGWFFSCAGSLGRLIFRLKSKNQNILRNQSCFMWQCTPKSTAEQCKQGFSAHLPSHLWAAVFLAGREVDSASSRLQTIHSKDSNYYYPAQESGSNPCLIHHSNCSLTTTQTLIYFC